MFSSIMLGKRRQMIQQIFVPLTGKFSFCDYGKYNRKKPPLGVADRFLTDITRVFQHNVWDNVAWDVEQETAAKQKVLENSAVLANAEESEKFEKEANKFWDQFYDIHQNKFFKDRHWLFTEFPELALGSTNSSSGSETLPSLANAFPGASANFRVLELGCGVGNTVFPLLKTNPNPELFLYACDFSSKAIDIVKNHSEYDTERCHAFVMDLSQEWDVPFPPNSLDVVILIFVLSAISPDRMQAAINNVAKFLKPGGRLLFRDYGRYDLAQLRFKKGRCLADNFYVRGDGTRVYFFTQEELKSFLVKAGLEEEQNLVDRRLQVNRGRMITMYRVWIQCKYRKPMTAESGLELQSQS